MKKLTAVALLLVSACSLAGCGKSPTAAPKPKKAPLQQMNRFGAPGALAQTPGAPTIPQILAAVHEAQARASGFTATVDTFDKGPGGQESDTIKVAYKKPSTLRLEMVKATGQAQGAKILWTGQDELKVKPTFSPFAVSLGITDDRMKSKNGWTIKETEVNAIFKVLFDPAAQIQLVGRDASSGKPLDMLQVHSAASPKGADHEIIGIDPTSGLPGTRMLFRGQEMLYKLTIKSIKLGVPSSSEMEI